MTLAEKLKKSYGFISMFILLTAMGYKVYRSKQFNLDLTKCPLGKFPLIDSISRSDFNKLYGSFQTGREYNLFVLFNARDPSAGCQMCPVVDHDFKKLVAGFPKRDFVEKKIAFAIVDLSNGRELFSQFGIQMAPALHFFKATNAGEKSISPIIFDIKHPMNSDNMAKFINSNLGGTYLNRATPNTRKNMLIAVFFIAVLMLLLAVIGKLSAVVCNPWLAMIATMTFIIAMDSGAMFCKIRNIPLNWLTYTAKNSVNPSMSHQTGAEAWVIGGLTLINAAGTIMLGSAIPMIKNPIGKRMATILFTVVVAWGFSTQLQIFRTKLPNYPYKFLF